MATKRPTFEQACAQYPHRFTMEHKPAWARGEFQPGVYYAPQYRSDREWYEGTRFPGEAGLHGNSRHCESGPATWPLGQTLTAEFFPAGKR